MLPADVLSVNNCLSNGFFLERSALYQHEVLLDVKSKYWPSGAYITTKWKTFSMRFVQERHCLLKVTERSWPWKMLSLHWSCQPPSKSPHYFTKNRKKHEKQINWEHREAVQTHNDIMEAWSLGKTWKDVYWAWRWNKGPATQSRQTCQFTKCPKILSSRSTAKYESTVLKWETKSVSCMLPRLITVLHWYPKCSHFIHPRSISEQEDQVKKKLQKSWPRLTAIICPQKFCQALSRPTRFLDHGEEKLRTIHPNIKSSRTPARNILWRYRESTME